MNDATCQMSQLKIRMYALFRVWLLLKVPYYRTTVLHYKTIRDCDKLSMCKNDSGSGNNMGHSFDVRLVLRSSIGELTYGVSVTANFGRN